MIENTILKYKYIQNMCNTFSVDQKLSIAFSSNGFHIRLVLSVSRNVTTKTIRTSLLNEQCSQKQKASRYGVCNCLFSRLCLLLRRHNRSCRCSGLWSNSTRNDNINIEHNIQTACYLFLSRFPSILSNSLPFEHKPMSS